MLRTKQSCHVAFPLLPLCMSKIAPFLSSTGNEREPLTRGVGCIGLNECLNRYANIIGFRLYS